MGPAWSIQLFLPVSPPCKGHLLGHQGSVHNRHQDSSFLLSYALTKESEASLCQARYVWRKVANSCFHSYSELLYPMGSYQTYLKYTLCFHLFCYSSLADGKRLSHPCWSTETYVMGWRTASATIPAGCFSFLILGGFWDGSSKKLCCKPLWPT